ncbi:NAD-dependent epimerase/dehydratase family protein [Gloeobacter kilaueensis]|uniref:NAD-dependent epimerase/dehydratase n=1 Tax=Gloeobacter kilaueensis (strain ATCC BAA-2537 / CCAP 1431/1 / ULC 316 / JS1) TaxID=1183438 RepID=U5QCV7_GLOK1|nr:NAD-dependent epimerase/dehydratase family protein [Gloeobacter kilaueensis]AGY56716.1 NAD-dependent epimerase/dehydratase [Gloeobacter kilaueensis JS1]
MTKHILITGVAGFLGSHLADALLARGHRVTGVDNLSMGSLANIAHNIDHPRFRFHQLDILDLAAFEAVAGDIDVVIHMAAFKIPRYGHRLDTLQINSRGTEYALEVARRAGAKFVFASTSDVYGNNPHVPFNEEDPIVLGSSAVARWAYAASKLYDEHLCWGYQEKYDIPCTVIRIFGSYGPRHHLSWWGGPQSVFIDQLLKNEPITLHGDGLQTRSFTFVEDTVSGFVAAAERAEANGELFNVGDDREIAIVDLARLLHELMGRPGEPELLFIPYDQIAGGRRYEDVRRRVPDNRKARRLLGFDPQVSLEEGLTRTLTWQYQVRRQQRQLLSIPS